MPARRRYKYYIFDLDGTLADSSYAIGKGLLAALEIAGLKNVPMEDTRRWIGRPLTEIFDAYLGDNGYKPPGEELFQKMLNGYREGHDAHFPSGVKIYPGVIETLNVLRAGGAKLAIATTKYQEAAEFVVCGLDLDRHVDCISGTDLGKPVKPDPYVIHITLASLGAGPGDTLVVGDTAADVLAAHAAGCDAAAVTYGFGDAAALKAAEPEIWLDRMEKLQ